MRNLWPLVVALALAACGVRPESEPAIDVRDYAKVFTVACSREFGRAFVITYDVSDDVARHKSWTDDDPDAVQFCKRKVFDSRVDPAN